MQEYLEKRALQEQKEAEELEMNANHFEDFNFEPVGDGGFGYDPYFISELGPMGLLTAEQKDAISHRGKALLLFKDELKNYIETNEEK